MLVKGWLQFTAARHRAAKVLIPMCLAGLVSACGSIESAPIENPNFFYGRVDDKTNVMSGLYNPAAFSSAQVKNVIATICRNKRLSSYSQARQEQLVAYSLTCSGGISPLYGYVSFEKRSGNEVLIESTGSDGLGNVMFSQATVKLGPRGAVSPVVPSAPPAAQPSKKAPTEAEATPSKPRQRNQQCANSITIYCKDASSGAVVPNVSPDD